MKTATTLAHNTTTLHLIGTEYEISIGEDVAEKLESGPEHVLIQMMGNTVYEGYPQDYGVWRSGFSLHAGLYVPASVEGPARVMGYGDVPKPDTTAVRLAQH